MRNRRVFLGLALGLVTVAFWSASAALRAGDLGDASSRKDLLLAVLESEDKAAAASPSVLAGIDLRSAPASVRKVARVLKETKVDLVLEKQPLETESDSKTGF